jgi:hypothetical protein
MEPPPRRARSLPWARLGLVASVLLCGLPAAAQDTVAGSISLVPAVVTLDATGGQAFTQTLSLTNHTSQALAFEMMALDVVARDGVRTFVPAGEVPGSIAASAVFSAPSLTVLPRETASVQVTLTFPGGTAVRAVAAGFRGLTQVKRADGVQMTGSLACLMTFSAPGVAEVAGSPIAVSPQGEATNLALEQHLHNTGTEPVLPRGAVALLDTQGRLVAKVATEPQRLLPGERLPFVVQFPGHLPAGAYRAIVSYEYAGRVLTATRDLTVPDPRDDGRRLAADARSAGPR